MYSDKAVLLCIMFLILSNASSTNKENCSNVMIREMYLKRAMNISYTYLSLICPVLLPRAFSASTTANKSQ